MAIAETLLPNLTDDELLRYVDRSVPEIKELAERLHAALFEIEGLKQALWCLNDGR